jgi:hypothetical protein
VVGLWLHLRLGAGRLLLLLGEGRLRPFVFRILGFRLSRGHCRFLISLFVTLAFREHMACHRVASRAIRGAMARDVGGIDRAMARDAGGIDRAMP